MDQFKTGNLVCLDCGRKLRYIDHLGTPCVDMCEYCREVVIMLAVNGVYDKKEEEEES